jgi:predicted TIM-barrel enzyme
MTGLHYRYRAVQLAHDFNRKSKCVCVYDHVVHSLVDAVALAAWEASLATQLRLVQAQYDVLHELQVLVDAVCSADGHTRIDYSF